MTEFETVDEAPKVRRGRGDAGFTLIELLVVIVILGILSAIVVFSVAGITDKGQGSACKIDTQTIATAEEAFLATPVAQGGGGGVYGSETALVGKFMSTASSLHDITVPAGGASYTITVATTACGTVGNNVGQTTSDL